MLYQTLLLQPAISPGDFKPVPSYIPMRLVMLAYIRDARLLPYMCIYIYVHRCLNLETECDLYT